MAATVRAHVVISADLVEEVDRLVGRRNRSRFVVEAVEAKLAQISLLRAARKAAGSLADLEMPDWETSDAAARWVHDLRREGERIPLDPE